MMKQHNFNKRQRNYYPNQYFYQSPDEYVSLQSMKQTMKVMNAHVLESKIQNGLMSLSHGINELRITRISYRQRWIVLSCVYTVKRTAHVLLSGLWEMNVLTDVPLKKR